MSELGNGIKGCHSSISMLDDIPALEIDNNDVKCSHSSAVGQIDKEKIFYLMSRGLYKSEAKKKIVEGYFSPILELLSNILPCELETYLLEITRTSPCFMDKSFSLSHPGKSKFIFNLYLSFFILFPSSTIASI